MHFARINEKYTTISVNFWSIPATEGKYHARPPLGVVILTRPGIVTHGRL
jgi:hypothetical protein